MGEGAEANTKEEVLEIVNKRGVKLSGSGSLTFWAD